MSTITISQAKDIIKQIANNHVASVSNGKNFHAPVMLHSSPGVGKSAIIRQICQEMSLGYVDLRLASLEPSEVCGIPYVSHAGKETEVMKFSIPEWFPTDAKIAAGKCEQFGIVFFDELSNAPVTVQQAAYRIILDRELQTGVKLPAGWIVIAAGNLKTDKTGVKGIAPALANRFATHLEVKADLRDFTDYAAVAGIHHHIVGFLNSAQECLYRFDPVKSSDTAFASPRSWEQASNMLKLGFNDEQLYSVLNGCVGAYATEKFTAFRKFYGQLPNFTDLLEGKTTFKLKKDQFEMPFAVASSLTDCIINNTDKMDKLPNLEHVLDQLPDDLMFVVLRSVLRSCHDTNREAVTKIVTKVFPKQYAKVKKYFMMMNQG